MEGENNLFRYLITYALQIVKKAKAEDMVLSFPSFFGVNCHITTTKQSFFGVLVCLEFDGKTFCQPFLGDYYF